MSEQKDVNVERPSPTAVRFKRIMIAIDGSAASRWALQVGGSLAAGLGAAAALVNVVDISKGFSPELGMLDDRVLNEQRLASVELLEQSQQLLPAGLTAARIVRDGEPAAEIIAAAQDWRADLVVLGVHARGPVARFLLGSTAEAVVRRAHCAVLTVGHEPPAGGDQEKKDCDCVGCGRCSSNPPEDHHARTT
jgi:nucleotide-binding universal stress UspA family protein